MRAAVALALVHGAAAFVLPGAHRTAPRPALASRRAHVQALDVTTLLGDRALTEEAMRAASGDLGWWGTYIKTVEDGLLGLHDQFQSMGIKYPYGLAIGCFVLGVKLVTLPLNFNQLSSSSQMKAVKPQQDRVRKWYGDNKNLLNTEVGSLFERLNINPLSGCLPSLAQIPVFLGVYYSVTSIAKARRSALRHRPRSAARRCPVAYTQASVRCAGEDLRRGLPVDTQPLGPDR